MRWWWAIAGCVSGVPTLTPVPADDLAAGTPEAVLGVVQQLAHPGLDGRDEGSAGSAAARALIVAQLEACGVAPAGEDGFLQEIGEGRGVNVVGRIPGTAHLPEGVMLSAHYDHQDTGWTTHPGAQDNAAAVGISLHVACAAARQPSARDLVVAFWDAEEPPTFLTPAMGSRWWRTHPTVPLDSLSAVVVMDLMGGGLWAGHRSTFALGTATSPALAAAVDATPVVPPLTAVHRGSLSLVEDMVVGRDMVWSDYETFRAADMPVVFLTDGQNRRYHQADDTFEHLDHDKLVAEAAWVEALMRRLGDAEVPATWDPSTDLDQDAEAVRALYDEAFAAKAHEAWGSTAAGSLETSRRSLPAEGARPDSQTLRRAAQKLMCWAGPMASSFTCGML